MTKELKIRSIIYGIGVLIYVCAVMVTRKHTVADEVQFVWFLAAYLVIGFGAFQELAEQILQKKFLTEYTLMILATVGAFGIARYREGVLVMLLFELGMIFESFATDSAKRSITKMLNIRPEYATRKVHGKEYQVAPSALKLGNTIVIKPGERIPVDAVVTEGTTQH